ncbi:MAG: Xaa-Pro peptidase family protein [Clostridiales bacterium]|nr:Xaa-Pro peptidase family protein [Clostridiales bacterium]
MVKSLMERENLDLLFVYSDDHAVFGPAYARWLSNWAVHFEPSFIVFTKKTDPVMVVGVESISFAKLHSHIKDIRILADFTHPDHDYPYSKPESLIDIVSSIADPGSCKRIGIAGRSMISYDLFKSFTDVLPGEWVTADEGMGMLRAVKTADEIEVMRYAYKIAQAGLEAAVRAIEPGVTERRVAAEAEYVMRKMGAECYGIDLMLASGMNNSPIISRPTMREIQKDDSVMITFAPRYEGYHGAVGIPVLVGDPPDEAKRAAEAAVRAINAGAALLLDGMGREADAAERGIMEEAGFGPNFMYSGVHSIGVIEFEAPIFGPYSDCVMRENMVLSIDIPVFDGEWGGMRIEDGFLAGKEKAERLTSIEYCVQK